MPKRKVVRRAQKTEKEKKTPSRNYTRIIFLTLVVVLIVGFFVQRANRQNTNQPTRNQAAYTVVTSTPQARSISVAPTPVSQANNQREVIIPDDIIPSPIVKKLPFTKGNSFKYTLKEGDSMAKIGNVFCNDPKAYLYLRELNNITEFDTLHPGDTIVVKCQ